MNTAEAHVIAERAGVVLRHATGSDLQFLDEITIICYEPIAASFINIVGQEFYRGTRLRPKSDWRADKMKQVRDAHERHPLRPGRDRPGRTARSGAARLRSCWI